MFPQVHRRALLSLGLAPWLAAGAACSRQPAAPATRPVPAGATVLALGDSITFGTGAAPGQDWPSVLAQAVGWQVVNAGVAGDTSAQALQRLPALLDAHRPALVIVSIGGNDLLRRQDEAALRSNLQRALQAVREAGAQALLVAVPRPRLAAHVTGSLDDHPLYADIAQAAAVPLHAGGWSAVLSDPRLKSDLVHANAEGYRVFAEGLRASLRRSGLLAH